MLVEHNSIRQTIALPSIVLVGLLLVFAAVVAAEAISTTPLVLFLGSDAGATLLRIATLSVTAAPIAYVTAYAIQKWVPALSSRIIPAIAVLWVLLIVMLQVYVYAPSVLGPSFLKILFVVIPLMLAGYRTRPRALA